MYAMGKISGAAAAPSYKATGWTKEPLWKHQIWEGGPVSHAHYVSGAIGQWTTFVRGTRRNAWRLAGGGMMRLQMHPFLCALLDRPLLGSHAVISLPFTSSPRRDTSRDTPLSRSLTEAFHVDRYGRRIVLSDLIGFTRLSSTSPNPPRCNNASQGTGHSCFCTLPGIANNHLE